MLEAVSKRYVFSVSLIVGVALSCVFLINCLIDPLWYFNGNVITQKNYAFNERLSKMNRFLRDPAAYDCYIFGSSRTTLLNEKRIQRYNCFNFSFSGGMIGEFLSFATYLKDKAYQPKLVIVGVDGFNFFTKGLTESVPEFIKRNNNPPSVFQNYLTVDALKFSYRAFIGKSPLTRYYKRDFSGDILPDTGPYDPNNRRDGDDKEKHHDAFHKEHYKWYETMASVFPGAKVIFYVPPISIWRIIEYRNNGTLGYYLHAMHLVGNIGHEMYDFSIPSYITTDKNRTYDGAHYDVDTNNLIVDTLNTGEFSFGLKVNGHSYERYCEMFLNAMDQSTNEVEIINRAPMACF